jgi:hypothetical protein
VQGRCSGRRPRRLLALARAVTDKLGETTRALPADDPTRGDRHGARPQDLYPNWPLAELSYAAPLAQEVGGGVLQIDPSFRRSLRRCRHREPWYPLLARAAPIA